MTEFGTATIPAIAVLIGLGLVIFFVVVIWSIKRHRDPTLRVECDALDRGADPVAGGPDAEHGGGRQ